MRASTKLNGTPFEMTEGTATFLSGGLASFTFWTAAIPADNVKKCLFFTSSFCLIANRFSSFSSPISAAYLELHWILQPLLVMLSERYINPLVGEGFSGD
jgi:hypothetical protein